MCGDKQIVLNFVSIENSKENVEVITDNFCLSCVVRTLDSYFGDNSSEIFNDFHKILTEKRKVAFDEHCAYYKVKDVMYGQLGDKLDASSFVFGVNHKTSIEEEEK
jgi:hypothetical protein